MHDGPTAIKPLTVKPQPQHSVQPNTVCDFEHQCYPEKGGSAASAPAAPPAIVVRPIAPRPQVPDEPVVATWRDCMDGALQTYEQSHNLHALQMATGSCQVRLEEQDGEDYGVADGEDYGAAEPRSRCRQLRGWLDGATSVAAGGPSAAMLTATVRRGVAASDDRKRKMTPNRDLQCFGDPPEPLRSARPIALWTSIAQRSASTGRVDEVRNAAPAAARASAPHRRPRADCSRRHPQPE